MSNRKRFKVLPISLGECSLYEDPYLLYEDCKMKEILPIFNRDGRYYDRYTKIVWEEYKGKAFLEKDSTMFMHEIHTSNATILTKEEENALRTAIDFGERNGICMKELREKLYYCKHKKDLRDTRREINKFGDGSISIGVSLDWFEEK